MSMPTMMEEVTGGKIVDLIVVHIAEVCILNEQIREGMDHQCF
jgi:hypothetical protein